MKRIALVATCLLAAASVESLAENNGTFPARSAASQTTDQLIVKWRADAQDPSKVQALQRSSKSGRTLHKQRAIAARIDVIKASGSSASADLESAIAALRADPNVEYVVPDRRRFPHAQPADPLLASQWYFLSEEPSATRAEHAWDVTTGSEDVIVAVLDTGVLFDHPDLGRASQGGKLLPGYDFVANASAANDGDGRDADPSDPGDWIDDSDTQTALFRYCDLSNSSWHGTRVSSLIAAMTNNGEGIAGGSWNSLILPVRVLGKCGGYDSDIIAAMRWAAGLTVPDTPANTTPAQIINMSLGAGGTCGSAYQDAVNDILAEGVLIVASVGNDGGQVGAPANCEGVLGVTGLRHAGTKVGFSNLGPGADLGAPGGNCVNTGVGQPCLYSITVAADTGTRAPETRTYTDQLNYNVGTSFSAPIVASAAALLRAVNPDLTPSQLTAVLKGTTTPFPTTSNAPVCQVPGAFDSQTEECVCTTATCGAGMLNMEAAVNALALPFAVVAAPSNIDPEEDVTLDASGSFAASGRTLTSYAWSIVQSTGSTPVIEDASAAITTLQVAGESEFTLRLTVTDDGGGQDSADFFMTTDAASTPPPTNNPPPTFPGGGGGGGGGSPGWEMLLLALLYRRRQRDSEPS